MDVVFYTCLGLSCSRLEFPSGDSSISCGFQKATAVRSNQGGGKKTTKNFLTCEGASIWRLSHQMSRLESCLP